MGFSTWVVKKQTNWFQEPKDRTLPWPSTSYWAELRVLPLSGLLVTSHPELTHYRLYCAPASWTFCSPAPWLSYVTSAAFLLNVQDNEGDYKITSWCELLLLTKCFPQASWERKNNDNTIYCLSTPCQHSSQQCLHHLIQSSQPPKEVGLYCC